MSWWLSVASANSYLPVAGTALAVEWDHIYNFALYVSIFFFFLLMGLTFFFVLKYRRRTETDKTPHITHSYVLEFLWSFVPLILMLGLAGWGWYVYHQMRTMPLDAEVQVNVFGKQWFWDFVYPSG